MRNSYSINPGTLKSLNSCLQQSKNADFFFFLFKLCSVLSVEVTETGGHQLVSRSSARGTSETPLAVRMPDNLGYTPEWPCRPLPESLSPADTWLHALFPAQEFKWGKDCLQSSSHREGTTCSLRGVSQHWLTCGFLWIPKVRELGGDEKQIKEQVCGFAHNCLGIHCVTSGGSSKEQRTCVNFFAFTLQN